MPEKKQSPRLSMIITIDALEPEAALDLQKTIMDLVRALPGSRYAINLYPAPEDTMPAR